MVCTDWGLITDRPMEPGVMWKARASDESVCEVLFGNTAPQGKLPFELPSFMEAVENQKTAVPYDSENPLFKFGFGLTY